MMADETAICKDDCEQVHSGHHTTFNNSVDNSIPDSKPYLWISSYMKYKVNIVWDLKIVIYYIWGQVYKFM